jgi:ParB family chromosome partitioning protein
MISKIEILDIDELTPYENNANEHSDAQVEEIAASILEFGFNDPLSVDEKKMLLTGHGTHMALKLLVSRGYEKFKKVPCSVIEDLSDRQKKAFILAHNKLSKKSTWNLEKLSAEMDALVNSDFDVSMIGFDEQEIDALLKTDLSILPDDNTPPVIPAADTDDGGEKKKRSKSKLVHKCPYCNGEFSA